MSQSATFYRVSQDTFSQLEKAGDEEKFHISSAKSYTTLQGTFMAIEYILSKGRDTATTELINEIFNPKQSLGSKNLENLTPEEQAELYESGSPTSYLDPMTISKFNDLLNKIYVAEIHSKYDADELNSNGIYPEVWLTDNSPDLAFNERHILEDFENLKAIIKHAEKDRDYIFIFLG